jgi:hypothetical protein
MCTGVREKKKVHIGGNQQRETDTFIPSDGSKPWRLKHQCKVFTRNVLVMVVCKTDMDLNMNWIEMNNVLQCMLCTDNSWVLQCNGGWSLWSEYGSVTFGGPVVHHCVGLPDRWDDRFAEWRLGGWSFWEVSKIWGHYRIWQLTPVSSHRLI